MKPKSVLLAAAVFLLATAVFAQQTVRVEDFASKVIESNRAYRKTVLKKQVIYVVYIYM